MSQFMLNVLGRLADMFPQTYQAKYEIYLAIENM